MSKVISNCFGFALLHSVIGLKNSRHSLNQSDAKPKPIGGTIFVLKLVPFRGENEFEPHPQSEILVPLRDPFKSSDDHPRNFYMQERIQGRGWGLQPL